MTAIDLERRSPRERLLPRFVTFGILVSLVVGALGLRLFQLQVADSGHYATLADDNRMILQSTASARGLIYDRNGVELVKNVPSFTVKIRPADLPFSKRESVVARLSRLLALETADINEAIDRNPGSRFDLVRIAADVPEATARLIAEEHLMLPGVQVDAEARREYPLGPLVSQLVGYNGPVSAEDLEKLREIGYLPDDTIGKAGVERVYETELRGQYGVEQVERDAAGRKIRVLNEVRPPIAGASLELSLDVKTQREAEKALKWAMRLAGLKRGVVIVMNPQTGEVLAMVSLPSYDNNLFARGITAKEYAKLATNAHRPLLNHAISEQFPPGSTYKLVAGTGALEDGKIKANERITTKPFLTLGQGFRFWEWNRRGWGPLNIYDGFGHSSDTYFFQVAGRLGIDRLAYWAKQYGFGERTGIDLPAEARGTVPSNEWKQEVFGQPIFPGETYQAGIGQGYDTATPIQLLNAYAALANGGKLYQPQIVRRIMNPDGTVQRDFEPQLIRELPVDPSVLRTMRLAARRVVTIGHTYNLVDLPIVVAGKSGTAEFGLRDKKGRLPYHSWFAAFVPKKERVTADDPKGTRAVARTDSELAVLAFAYDSRTKGNVATEIVKYFLQIHYGIKKDLRNFDLLKRGNFYQGN
ncbi:MAG: penicillin-binding protein 2 [Candidatus Limnocylindrales bacterium]